MRSMAQGSALEPQRKRHGCRAWPRCWGPTDAELVRRAVSTARALTGPKDRDEGLASALRKVGDDPTRPTEVRLDALAAVPGGLADVTPELFAFFPQLTPDHPVVAPGCRRGNPRQADTRRRPARLPSAGAHNAGRSRSTACWRRSPGRPTSGSALDVPRNRSRRWRRSAPRRSGRSWRSSPSPWRPGRALASLHVDAESEASVSSRSCRRCRRGTSPAARRSSTSRGRRASRATRSAMSAARSGPT